MKKLLAVIVLVCLLGYAGFYTLNGISSGDHWKFVHTFIGLFLFSLVFYWLINLNQPPELRKKVNNQIKKVLIAAFCTMLILFWAFIFLIYLFTRNANS